jgi:hypothetical protein
MATTSNAATRPLRPAKLCNLFLLKPYAAAFAAKRVAPAVPLPVFFIACQLIDGK